MICLGEKFRFIIVYVKYFIWWIKSYFIIYAFRVVK